MRKSHPTQKHILQLTADISITIVAGVSSLAGWPLIQIKNICVERG
jgi:hypothetical protein